MLAILVSLLRMGCCASTAVAAPAVPLTVSEDAGVARTRGQVTSGVPFPIGLLKSDQQLRLLDEQGREVALQTRTTATWRDGSVKWVLLDFQTGVPAGGQAHFRLEHGDGVRRTAPQTALHLREEDRAVRVATGPLAFSIPLREGCLLRDVALDRDGDGAFEDDEVVVADGVRLSVMMDEKSGGFAAVIRPPNETRVEEAGPLRAVIRATGWIEDGSGNRLFRYDSRAQTTAGSSQVRLALTLTQLADRAKMVWVRDLSLRLPLKQPGRVATLGGQPAAHQFALDAGRQVTLSQLREGAYSVRSNDAPAGRGFHAPGWVEVTGSAEGVLVGCRDFWQQHPKSLSARADGIEVGLYPGSAPQPFDWDQGLAKTHELLLDFHANARPAEDGAARSMAFDRPLFAVAPAAWYCDSKVFGELRPFDFDLFPDYETLTEASGDQFVRRMATGLRHWGDVYYGGEYKGTNSYANLEYDMHHNFFCQFARTGLRKYLDPALVMARHQVDIDTNHKTGWPWKHSPRHVEIQAEFGHTFTRGLIEAWHLSGDRRCLETAIELGDYFAREIANPRATGNERQIGWALISLLPVYEATWDRKYFEAASNTVERLMAGLDATGRFNIRWDNRIAFFNGIAATGFLYYHRATGDERVAEAALRVIQRARGFYTEYNGRTLEAIAWACERTQAPEWSDFLARTWETTLARQISANVMELGAPTIFTVHALPFLARGGLLPKANPPFALTPAQFDSCRGLQARHLPAGEADLYLELDDAAPLNLLIIRKGAWKDGGTATLFDPEGREIEHLPFPKESALWQRQALHLIPRTTGAFRLACRAPGAMAGRASSGVTWDVVSSRPVRGVFSTPQHRGLELVTPRLFAGLRGDTARVELEVAGEGEGFKRAAIFDPAGQLAGSAESFIDLGDRGRYYYKVSAEVPPAQAKGVWSVVLDGVTLEKMTGLTPYFSTSPESFFRPDRGASRREPAQNAPAGSAAGKK